MESDLDPVDKFFRRVLEHLPTCGKSDCCVKTVLKPSKALEVPEIKVK